MKFITKTFIVALLLGISFSTVESSKSSNLLKRRNKTKNGGCSKVVKGTADENIDATKDIYPGDTQLSNTDAKANAVLQTKAARNLFYNPPNSVMSVIKNVASNYSKFITAVKKDTDTDPFYLFGKIQRQTSSSGTWQVFNKIKATLNLDEGTFHSDVVGRLSKGADILPRDILGFLGFLGDLGASLQDSINRLVKPEEQQIEPAITIKKIKTVLLTYFGKDLETKSKSFYDLYSPDKYYDNATKSQSKKGERRVCSDGGKMKLAERAGILGVGKEVDATIDVGTEKASKLKAEKQLPSVGWPWQTVPKKLVDFCPAEPWAGHFSGSLYELILMLEIFDRADPKTDSAPSKEKKNVYTALASAFLMGTGMHSAVELVYVDKLYTGLAQLTADKILSAPDVCTNASRVVSKIITDLK